MTVLLSDFSLTGFWTDIIFSISLFIFSLVFAFKRKMEKRWLTIAVRAISISFIYVIFSLLSPFMTIFFPDTFKLKSFYLLKVDSRIFNAYFKPVGAYSGGYGNFLITESPKYFAIIERPVYFDRTVHYDFSEDTFDGKPVNNKEIITQIIVENIINKK
jgi:energy-coupling factor transporter transmembrane protein EcfT